MTDNSRHRSGLSDTWRPTRTVVSDRRSQRCCWSTRPHPWCSSWLLAVLQLYHILRTLRIFVSVQSMYWTDCKITGCPCLRLHTYVYRCDCIDVSAVNNRLQSRGLESDGWLTILTAG